MLEKCLILGCQQKLRRIACKHIYYMHYMDGAISIYLTSNETIYHCKKLSEIETKLPDYFLRINRNVIINLNYLSAYFKGSQKVVLENGQEFDVSRRNIGQLLAKLKPVL